MLAAEQRKRHLISKLRRFGVYLSKDNRNLEYLSLYELEWLHIELLNELKPELAEG